MKGMDKRWFHLSIRLQQIIPHVTALTDRSVSSCPANCLPGPGWKFLHWLLEEAKWVSSEKFSTCTERERERDRTFTLCTDILGPWRGGGGGRRAIYIHIYAEKRRDVWAEILTKLTLQRGVGTLRIAYLFQPTLCFLRHYVFDFRKFQMRSKFSLCLLDYMVGSVPNSLLLY